MSIPELLKAAINNQDWDKVAEAYSMLTGVKITLGPKPKHGRGRPKKATQLAMDEAARQAMEPERIRGKTTSYVVMDDIQEVDPAAVAVITGKKQQLNKFQDDGKLFRNDAEQDKKMWAGKTPTERRPPVQTIEVNCKKCSALCKVFPDDLPGAVAGENPRDNYICEKCLGRRR